MNRSLYAEIASVHENRYGEGICGDTFQTRSLSSGRRIVAVLSDGMGHGVKANILSNLTSGMMLKMVETHDDLDHIAGMILDSLPVCEIRKVSYATFAIADINTITGDALLAHHDSPDTFIVRQGRVITPEWKTTGLEHSNGRKIFLHTAKIRLVQGDNVVMCTDGVAQSGQKNSLYRFGWGGENLKKEVLKIVENDKEMSAENLAAHIVSTARANDGMRPADDTSCSVIKLREPGSLLFISCPPSSTDRNTDLVRHAAEFTGQKIICGTPVARIIADGTGTGMEKIDVKGDFVMKIPGFDLVTDGVIVPNRVLDLLENWQGELPDIDDSAHKICRMLMQNDHIELLIGMKKTIDPSGHSHDIFELRRNILYRLASILENRFQKSVRIVRI